jgi:hypothetical protein
VNSGTTTSASKEREDYNMAKELFDDASREVNDA